MGTVGRYNFVSSRLGVIVVYGSGGGRAKIVQNGRLLADICHELFVTAQVLT